MKHRQIVDTMVSLYEGIVDSRYKKDSDFTNKQGIYFKVEVSNEALGFTKDNSFRNNSWRKRCSRFVHVVILKNHKLFVKIEDGEGSPSFIIDVPDCDDSWKNISNHDTAYKESLEYKLWDIVGEVYGFTWNNTPEEHTPSLAESNLSIKFCHKFSTVPFKFVEVDLESIKDDSGFLDNYFKKLTSIKFISKTITL